MYLFIIPKDGKGILVECYYRNYTTYINPVALSKIPVVPGYYCLFHLPIQICPFLTLRLAVFIIIPGPSLQGTVESTVSLNKQPKPFSMWSSRLFSQVLSLPLSHWSQG